jgi:hypothetical protein
MIFNQLATNTIVFLYQFVFPFAVKIDKLTTVKEQIKRLKSIKPRNSKSKQTHFKKLYVKIWKQVLDILKNERALRAHVNYMPQLHLIRALDTYIDPIFHQEIFGDGKILNAHFFIIFFDFRNEDIKKQILEIFKYGSGYFLQHSDEAKNLSFE